MEHVASQHAPASHDVSPCSHWLQELRAATAPGSSVAVPRYDKSAHAGQVGPTNHLPSRLRCGWRTRRGACATCRVSRARLPALCVSPRACDPPIRLPIRVRRSLAGRGDRGPRGLASRGDSAWQAPRAALPICLPPPAPQGDRAPRPAWPLVQGPVDVVLFEGWMLGFSPIRCRCWQGVHADTAACMPTGAWCSLRAGCWASAPSGGPP